MSDVSNDITIAGYHFKRLQQVGLHAVHGVPGNHNIAVWREAVLVIVTPQCRTHAQDSKFCHSFFDAQPDSQILADWFEKITIIQEFLVHPSEATTQIDTAIRQCIMQSLPVCIGLPEDLVNRMAPAKGLVQCLDFNTPPHDTEMEIRVVASIMNKIKRAERPVILADAGVPSCGLIKEANQLAKKTKFPTAATQFSRGVVDESLKNFHGDISDFDMYGLYFRSCDLILRIGPLNTTEWANLAVFEAKTAETVTFNRCSVVIGDQKYELFSRPVLQQILNCIDERELRDLRTYPDLPNVRNSIEMVPLQEATAPLQHGIYSTFRRRMSVFFRPHDIILTETKTAQDGARSFVLPRDTTLINPGARGLPGYMLAVAMGVTLAQQSLAKPHYLLSHGRTILFEGERDFQKAQNDLRAIIDKNLNLIIFVINEGPVVESLMHAMEYQRQGSDPWRYSESVSFFGTPQNTSYPVSITIARTWGDFDMIIHDKMIRSGRGLHVVEFMIKP